MYYLAAWILSTTNKKRKFWLNIVGQLATVSKLGFRITKQLFLTTKKMAGLGKITLERFQEEKYHPFHLMPIIWKY